MWKIVSSLWLNGYTGFSLQDIFFYPFPIITNILVAIAAIPYFLKLRLPSNGK